MGQLPPNILSVAVKGKHNDGGGLYLYSKGRDDRGKARGAWVYRFTQHGKRYEYGLGSVSELTLAEARKLRDHWASRIMLSGVNPIDEKRRLEAEAKREKPTLSQLAPEAFKAIRETLKDDGKAGRWYSPLELYALPALGHMRIEEIHQTDIERALRPIWHSKHPTARKILSRLAAVFRHGAAKGLNVDQNAIVNAKALLGAVDHKESQHPAIPLDELRRLYSGLTPDTSSQRALMLYILIGAGSRIGPLRTSKLDQIDGDVWVFPGVAMKGRRGKTSDFRCPVTDAMKPLIETCRAQARDGFMFPGLRKGVVSDQAIENLMREREREWGWPEPYRLHGIRATFRTWAERQNFRRTASEAQIAHTVESSLSRRYQRDDFLDERRAILDAWNGELTLEPGTENLTVSMR